MPANPGDMGSFHQGVPFRYLAKGPTGGFDHFSQGVPFRGMMAAGPPPPKLLLEDGLSGLLLEDGTSFLLLEGDAPPAPASIRPRKFVWRRHR